MVKYIYMQKRFVSFICSFIVRNKLLIQSETDSKSILPSKEQKELQAHKETEKFWGKLNGSLSLVNSFVNKGENETNALIKQKKKQFQLVHYTISNISGNKNPSFRYREFYYNRYFSLKHLFAAVFLQHIPLHTSGILMNLKFCRSVYIF